LLKLNKLSEKHQNLEGKRNDKSLEIIEFLLKYQNTNKIPTQKELNKLLLNLGISELETNNSITKEVAFKLIDFYFNYLEENKQTHVEALDKVNEDFSSLSYVNFRNQIKAVNPNVKEAEIHKVYLEMQEKLKNL